MLFSSRRCIVLMTTLLLFWIVFIGTIVSYPPASLTPYTSKFGLGREDVEAPQAQLGAATGALPLSWMKNTYLLHQDEPEAVLPLRRITPKPTQELEDTHNEIFSHISPDGKFFRIDFGEDNVGINPNVIPHPYHPGLWIAVAQEYHGLPSTGKPITPWSVEMVCNANFSSDGTLRCTKPPRILPIASTPFSPKCPPDLEIINVNVGPHDARVFYGPAVPYTTFGSQSQYSCLGQFVQDFRYLVDWGLFRTASDVFSMATDIQKPNAGAMEKNFFLFWDLNGAVYAHYDVHPARAFSKLHADGTTSADLAPRAKTDALCWEKHLQHHPLPTDVRSSIHQATNSLAITLCRRADPDCEATADNTFLFHIFHHKVYTDMFRSRYDPYLVLFRPTAPFAMHAVTARPLWIHGRTALEHMLYITAVSWMAHGQTYQGFLDDRLLVTFGIEDSDTGAIDLTAEELLGELMFC